MKNALLLVSAVLAAGCAEIADVNSTGVVVPGSGNSTAVVAAGDAIWVITSFNSAPRNIRYCYPISQKPGARDFTCTDTRRY